MLKAVIMAGGSGTRFWPMSRECLPKQFLPLFGKRTLLQQAVDRILDLVGRTNVLVMTNASHVARTREQLPEIPPENIVGEPVGRDTAACIGLAALLCQRDDPAARMVVLAADHVIEPAEGFRSAVRAADWYLDSHPQTLITFGIPPTYAATGYGYLRRAELAGEHNGVNVYRLASFHEKPDRPRAEQFLASGEFFWNSGMFVWNASTILDEIGRNIPSLLEGLHRIAAAWGTPEQQAVLADEYPRLEKKSIDFAVMEHAREVAMVETPFSWDDVGSWLALERVRERNDEGNVILGQHLGIDTHGCVIAGEGGHLIATIGVDDLIIVHTPDVTLVARRQDEQRVKELHQLLAQRGISEFR